MNLRPFMRKFATDEACRAGGAAMTADPIRALPLPPINESRDDY